MIDAISIEDLQSQIDAIPVDDLQSLIDADLQSQIDGQQSLIDGITDAGFQDQIDAITDAGFQDQIDAITDAGYQDQIDAITDAGFQDQIDAITIADFQSQIDAIDTSGGGGGCLPTLDFFNVNPAEIIVNSNTILYSNAVLLYELCVPAESTVDLFAQAVVKDNIEQTCLTFYFDGFRVAASCATDFEDPSSISTFYRGKVATDTQIELKIGS